MVPMGEEKDTKHHLKKFAQELLRLYGERKTLNPSELLAYLTQ